MNRRSRLDAIVLAFFLAATAVQFLLHAHVGDDRHHVASCHDSPEARRGPHPILDAHRALRIVATPDESSLPGGHEHGACPRCTVPSAALRDAAATAAVLAALGATDLSSLSVRSESAPRLGYELRGPPRG